MTRRVKGLRWWIIGAVMLGTIVNYLTRSTLSVAAPTFMADLSIDEQQYSWITAAFQAGIMLQPIVGYILDVIGLRTGLAIFATGWGIFTIAHGFATNWQWLGAMRRLLGLAEGTSHTGGMKVASEWFPAKERGFASGIYNLGASAGAALAAPLVAGAIILWDWRAAFYIAGALALVWVALWLFLYRPPQTHPAITPGELDHIEGGQEPELAPSGRRPSIPSLLKQRNFWGIALPRFLADPTWGTLTFWMPLYL